MKQMFCSFPSGSCELTGHISKLSSGLHQLPKLTRPISLHNPEEVEFPFKYLVKSVPFFTRSCGVQSVAERHVYAYFVLWKLKSPH